MQQTHRQPMPSEARGPRGAGNEPKGDCAMNDKPEPKSAATFDGLCSRQRRVRRMWDEHHSRRLADQAQHFDIDRPDRVVGNDTP